MLLDPFCVAGGEHEKLNLFQAFQVLRLGLVGIYYYVVQGKAQGQAFVHGRDAHQPLVFEKGSSDGLGIGRADAEVIGKAARGGEQLGAAELFRVDKAPFLQLFHVIVALVAPDLHQNALLDGLLVSDDGQGSDERSLDFLGSEGEDPTGQAEANLHGIALANALDLDARVAGGILRCQVVRQSCRPLLGESWRDRPAPWERGFYPRRRGRLR